MRSVKQYLYYFLYYWIAKHLPNSYEFGFIGARAIILKGVKIGKYAVVGAGSVVTKDVPDYAIVARVPARILRMRK